MRVQSPEAGVRSSVGCYPRSYIFSASIDAAKKISYVGSRTELAVCCHPGKSRTFAISGSIFQNLDDYIAILSKYKVWKLPSGYRHWIDGC